MKIKLIKPDERIATNASSAMTFKIQQLNLPLLAAYTPPEHDIEIVDESFEQDCIGEDVDLVGITVMTQLARRAYHIADTYRKQGVKVVMGGIHPSAVPEEALHHADSVVIGEGEGVWSQLLDDAEKGELKTRYQAQKKIPLDGRPMPRFDLYPKTSLKGYTPSAFGVETSRGCPFNCDFCSVGLIMGHQYRLRPVDEVIEEIKTNRSSNIFFVDDNLALNRRKAKELFSRMIPLKRRWVGEGGVSLAEDTELLRLMKRSGCQALLIGFESVQKQTQQSMLKTRKLKIDYTEAMKRFHGEGISILGAFVFGFDHENKDIFEQTYNFAAKNCIELAQLRPVVPFPGTQLYQRLREEKRLFSAQWWLEEGRPRVPLFRPQNMTEEEFADGMRQLGKHFYSYGSIIRRFFGIKPWKRNAANCHMYLGANLAFRKRYNDHFVKGGKGEKRPG
ncbi:MAG: radical SAM protein [Candidatus Aminicenantes bacterium]|nr:radical SAM protein [Candidatus Aminicenantes bacterium]